MFDVIYKQRMMIQEATLGTDSIPTRFWVPTLMKTTYDGDGQQMDNNTALHCQDFILSKTDRFTTALTASDTCEFEVYRITTNEHYGDYAIRCKIAGKNEKQALIITSSGEVEEDVLTPVESGVLVGSQIMYPAASLTGNAAVVACIEGFQVVFEVDYGPNYIKYGFMTNLTGSKPVSSMETYYMSEIPTWTKGTATDADMTFVNTTTKSAPMGFIPVYCSR